ncbi:hypothetical protein AJ88_16035 [Mesorhizobium amorphae CCBAU 01583]|nr:hypothetical protein AJ88_16035 [Mesorhizobium amorphae CCBAU 01583]
MINQAMEWFERRSEGVAIFGGEVVKSPDAQARRAVAAKLMPRIRGLISEKSHKLGHFDDSAAVLEFVNSRDLRPLAALGTSCPDHFLRTKIRPLVIEFDPAKPDVDAVIARLADDIAAYRVGYQAYYDSCKHADSPAIRDPNAVVYLMPGSACSPSPATRRPPAFPANSTSTPSTSCAAPRPSRPMSACPHRKLSKSNTGCSRT